MSWIRRRRWLYRHPGASTGPPVDPGPVVPSASFLGTDSTTGGSWKGHYGPEGWAIAADPSADATSLPGWLSSAWPSLSSAAWTTASSDPRALQLAAAGSSLRVAGAFYSSTSIAIPLTVADRLSHRVAVYCLDWDSGGRSQRLDLVASVGGAVLDSRSVSGFSAGVWLSWAIAGDVSLLCTNLNGLTNCVLAGVFFG